MSTLNGNISYTCFADADHEIMWVINGTQLQELNLNNVQDDTINVGIAILAIVQLTAEFNGTIIQCRTQLSSGAVVNSEISKLIVRGTF